ncbi:hypothetical protein CABS01_16274 [Colletotrichum abscissum]|uniref:Uncharacterized protein n=1 Tax=Colletotrichum abscissum TaxID=1671311 RepID=A0A9P9X1S1_9PEZI|nr:uncharacterized protein CABS01_16274 [Colletotrichum abscissum]KAI3531712.1 hypothetical protein CABS02_14077 [Colletotrichum abscissum]KAK1472543.1 hypothetical protein CABS01_16274 [Colletotrichum abscissum]
MVSFFGLKLGADKKKKPAEKAEMKPQWKKIDQNTLGQGQFFGKDLDRPILINGSRPGTAMSNKSFAANFRHPNAPYLNGGSSSLVDLGAPGVKGIRPVGSEANLNMRWNNTSVTSLNNIASPPIITGGNGSGSRPGTPNSARAKAWVNPLDVHFARDGAGPRSDGALSPAPSAAPSGYHSPNNISPLPTPTAANAPRSPLGQFEFNLNPSESSKDDKLTPAPLSPNKALPSPPQSINGSLPPLRTDLRPKTAVTAVREAHRPRPAALPSPTASAGRSSDEDHFYPRPIIQNVAAKRDTLTITTPRRQSFSMDIDNDPTGLDFGMAERGRTLERESPIIPISPVIPVSPPPRSARRPRPPEMKILPEPPRSAGLPPPRPQQVPYEGPLRSPARPLDDWPPARQRQDSDAREMVSPTRDGERVQYDSRERQGPELRERKDSGGRSRDDLPSPPQGYLGPPPTSRRVAPGEGERNYGVTPANRRQPPPPVELQRKASNPQQYQPPSWDDRDVHHGNFAMVSPRMQSPQPPTPNSLIPEASNDANWPLPSPLASPTFGSQRPQTPKEKAEAQQMSPPPVLPPPRERGDARRPDFGLRAPTGIADEFRVGFI